MEAHLNLLVKFDKRIGQVGNTFLFFSNCLEEIFGDTYIIYNSLQLVPTVDENGQQYLISIISL